jgi:3-oxoacyl-[acyl-carrier protein] reductase
MATGILKDKVALVTGSSRGIGAAIAKILAREGAKVAIHGRDESALARVAGELEWTESRVVRVVADVTRFAEIEDARRQIERKLGPVELLVANAGGSFTSPGPIEETSEDGWRASVDGNLTATFLTIKSFLPGMKERRAGNIITLSSAAARRPHTRSPIAYSVAKAGIELMTQDVAAQAIRLTPKPEG